MSQSNSVASSTRHILPNVASPLEPPTAPFAASQAGPASPSRGSFRSLTPSNTNSGIAASDSGAVSLSVNFLPNKFSRPRSPGVHKRKNAKGGPTLPKRGGGIEAFKSGEARMPGAADEDYDGVTGGWFGGSDGKTKPKLRWTKFKWILFGTNFCVSTVYPS